jgi:hypothetical protein
VYTSFEEKKGNTDDTDGMDFHRLFSHSAKTSIKKSNLQAKKVWIGSDNAAMQH